MVDFRRVIEFVACFGDVTSKRLSDTFFISRSHAANDLLRGFKMGFLKRKRLPGPKVEYSYSLSERGNSYNSRQEYFETSRETLNYAFIIRVMEGLAPNLRWSLLIVAYIQKDNYYNVPPRDAYSAFIRDLSKMFR